MVRSTVAVTAVALATAVTGNLFVAAFATLITSGASAIAKASLDASLQDDLPEASRASAFGRSESLLQLAWVAGGATGVLIYTDLWVGFTAITAVLILGLAQTVVSYHGESLIPGLRREPSRGGRARGRSHGFRRRRRRSEAGRGSAGGCCRAGVRRHGGADLAR